MKELFETQLQEEKAISYMKYKEKINYFLEKLKGEFSILEIKNLFDEIEGIFSNNIKEILRNLSDEEGELFERLLKRGFYKRVSVYESYINKWDKGLWFPNEEELKNLKNYQKKFNEKVLSGYNDIIEQTSSPSVRSTIEEEKAISIEKKKILDKLLKNDEYREKAEEALRNQGNNQTPPNNDEVKKLANLFKKVNELEEKLKKNPNSESDKQELTRLRGEIEDLKRKQKKDDKKDERDKKNNFPTKLLIGGVVVVMLLIVFFFFFGR